MLSVAITLKVLMSHSKIAYFGHPGSFTSIAALKFAKKYKIGQSHMLPCQTFDEVMQYVLNDNVYGVVPSSNSSVGSVDEYVKLDKKYKDLVTDEISVPIHHCLLQKGQEKITHVVSHPHALLQCKKYLNKNFPSAKLVDYSTTSTAARDLSLDNLPTGSAVIASEKAADIYGLRVQDSNIEDDKNNVTNFKVLFNKAIRHNQTYKK